MVIVGYLKKKKYIKIHLVDFVSRIYLSKLIFINKYVKKKKEKHVDYIQIWRHQ